VPGTYILSFGAIYAFRVNDDAFGFKIHLHANAADLMRRVSLILFAGHVPHAFDTEDQVGWDLLTKLRSEEGENCFEGVSVEGSDTII
jgi:hypothetical protein